MKKHLGPQKIIEKKQQYIMPCLSHFYAQPPEIVRGSMQYLFDHTGKKYLDCFAGVSVINCGHCNPEITDKLCEQIKTLQHVCNIYLTEPFVRLAERLAAGPGSKTRGLAGVLPPFRPGTCKNPFFARRGRKRTKGHCCLLLCIPKAVNIFPCAEGFMAVPSLL